MFAVEHAPVRRSAPYSPAAGDAPSVAMAKFGMPCKGYVLAAEVSLRRAGEWMASALAPGDDAYLVDDAGRLLAQARRSEPDYLRDLSRLDLVRSALTSPDASLQGSTDPIGGTPGVAATAPVGATGWRVIVFRPASPIRPAR